MTDPLVIQLAFSRVNFGYMKWHGARLQSGSAGEGSE